MSWKNFLFGFRGRINREKIWLVLLATIGLAVAYNALFFVFFGTLPSTFFASSNTSISHQGISAIWPFVLFFVYLVVNMWVGFAGIVKRLHDRNKSAWWAVVMSFLIFLAILSDGLSASGRLNELGDFGAVLRLIGPVVIFWDNRVWRISLLMIIVMMWYVVELYVLPGTKGSNRFGPDPLAEKL